MIEIKPDPKHPRGGFAELTLPGLSAPSAPITVAVFNSYQQKWLGPEGWQPNRAEIPARSAVQEGTTLRVIIGPDIVNQIEEDTPIRLDIAGQSFDTYWPDDINAGPDEAVLGDIGGTGAAPEAKGPTALAAEAPEIAAPAPPPPPAPAEDVLSGVEPGAEPSSASKQAETISQTADEAQTEPGKKGPLLWAAIGAVLLAAAVVAYFVLQPAAPDPAPAPLPTPVPTPPAPPVAASDPCSADALQALAGFADLAAQMRSCAGTLSPDAALGFVERAAQAGDADALTLFGTLYDATVTDAALEDAMGLTFADQPARAAEYYARAVDAGSEEAQPHLRAICLRLNLLPDTLSQSAREDYCQ